MINIVLVGCDFLLHFVSATILQTMRNDGNVMIAVDTAGRMLELAQLLVRTICVTHFELTLTPQNKD